MPSRSSAPSITRSASSHMASTSPASPLASTSTRGPGAARWPGTTAIPVPAATRQATSSSAEVSSNSAMAADAAALASPFPVPGRGPAAAQQATSRAARSRGATRAAAASSSREASRTGGSLGGPPRLPVPDPEPLPADVPPAGPAAGVPVPPVSPSPVAAGGTAVPGSGRGFRREVATPAPYDVGAVRVPLARSAWAPDAQRPAASDEFGRVKLHPDLPGFLAGGARRLGRPQRGRERQPAGPGNPDQCPDPALAGLPGSARLGGGDRAEQFRRGRQRGFGEEPRHRLGGPGHRREPHGGREAERFPLGQIAFGVGDRVPADQRLRHRQRRLGHEDHRSARVAGDDQGRGVHPP